MPPTVVTARLAGSGPNARRRRARKASNGAATMPGFTVTPADAKKTFDEMSAAKNAEAAATAAAQYNNENRIKEIEANLPRVLPLYSNSKKAQ